MTVIQLKKEGGVVNSEMEKVTELANLVRRKLFVSQKIFVNIIYNP